jgi:protein SCO1/2
VRDSWLVKAQFVSLGLLTALALGGCSKPASRNEPVYPVRGIVRAIDPSGGNITVEHEDVPGFMPAMTMPFQFRDRSEIEPLKPGMGVAFELVVGPREAWIRNVRTIDPDSVKLPAATPKPATSSEPARLKEGDPLPAFQLIDQSGKPLTKESFSGKALVLTFIFTRCPIPNFCPLISQHFTRINEAIAADPALADQVRLLSISFDPYDTPDVLNEHAKALGADPARWTFATGDSAEIDKLTRAFSVRVEKDGATINHGLCTALVSPDGVIRRIWRGNGWKPSEVLEAIKNPAAP